MEVEPQNPPNTEEPSENLNSNPDTSTRTLFYTPILISPFDESTDSSGLHAIGRPVGERFYSPPNRILSLPNSRVPRFLNNTNFRRPRIAGQESVHTVDPFLQTPNLPVEPTLPPLTITELGEEENFETEVRVNPQGGSSSNSSFSSSSSGTPPPPPPPNPTVPGPVPMAQP